MKFRILNLRLLSAAVVVLCLAAVAASARQDKGEEIADPERPEVTVSLSALDKEGRPVEGLKAEDLRVTADGLPQQLLYFKSRADEPLHVVVMLDVSASQEGSLRFTRPAAVSLLSVLLRPGQDDAAVVTFTNEAKVVAGPTSDAEALARAVESVRFVAPPGYVAGGVVVGRVPRNDPALNAITTAVWDSLVEVCDEVFARAKGGRRVIFLISDGVDVSSRLKPDKAVARLVSEGVNVYSVGVGDSDSFDGVAEGDLRKVSERTGGRAFFPKKAQDLAQYLEQTRRELTAASYALRFKVPPTPADGKPYKLRVEVVNPELRRRGVRLAYPQSLYKSSAAAP